ncbi:hypothetical protein, partial [Longimicrobium sp.]|uniref:hypothetical protein n=1 Tax=Longimicrobium sp. TaxID=2029185 RepID=UPI002E311CCD
MVKFTIEVAKESLPRPESELYACKVIQRILRIRCYLPSIEGVCLCPPTPLLGLYDQKIVVIRVPLVNDDIRMRTDPLSYFRVFRKWQMNPLRVMIISIVFAVDIPTGEEGDQVDSES